MLDLQTCTWPEAQAALERGRIALVAIGAQEQHGPHLPLSTDTIMAAGLARRLAERLDGLLLPPVPYGECWNNSRFPGTVSISFDTVRALITDIGLGMKQHGARGLVVVNGHFGNRSPAELACRALTWEHGFPAMTLDYPGLERAAKAVCESEPAGFGFMHADEVETSMVLAERPETVRMERARAEYPVFPPDFPAAPVYLDSLSESGVFGDPRPATAEKGERLYGLIEKECLKILGAWMENFSHRKDAKNAKNHEEDNI